MKRIRNNMFYLLSPDELRKKYYGLKKINQIIDRSALEDNEFGSGPGLREQKLYQKRKNIEETNLLSTQKPTQKEPVLGLDLY